jgi:N6-adenosine-specific RNA methylase IME4
MLILCSSLSHLYFDKPSSTNYLDTKQLNQSYNHMTHYIQLALPVAALYFKSCYLSHVCNKQRDQEHEALRMQQSRGFEVLTIMSWYHGRLGSDAV